LGRFLAHPTIDKRLLVPLVDEKIHAFDEKADELPHLGCIPLIPTVLDFSWLLTVSHAILMGISWGSCLEC